MSPDSNGTGSELTLADQLEGLPFLEALHPPEVDPEVHKASKWAPRPTGTRREASS